MSVMFILLVRNHLNLKKNNMVIMRNHQFPEGGPELDAPNTYKFHDRQEAVNDLNEIRVDDDLQEPNPEGTYEPMSLVDKPENENKKTPDINTSAILTQQVTSKLNGLRVLITGGTTGIGRQLALEIAALGGNVLIAGLDEQHLKDTISDSRQADLKGMFNSIIADMSTADGVTRFFEEADNQFGGEPDVLINNAALAFQSVIEGSFKDWQKVIDTNLLGYIACTHEAVARMTRKGKGHIVFIGSMSAEVRERGSSVYVATKSGVEGFAASLRKEVNEKGIRVTLIEPGAVDTNMQPQSTTDKKEATEQHTMLKAEDIVAAVIYALSQEERCDVTEIRLRPRLQLI
jgi:NAD(P)-dependent dehydrogenase (short-subunit alcohol dehydrogenase family)